MRPVVDRLEKEFSGKVDVRRMNTSTGDAEVERLAQVVGVEYVPTFVFAAADGSIKNQVVGGMTEEQLRSQMSALAQ